MDIAAFRKEFWDVFKGAQRNEPDYSYWDPLIARQVDPCFDVEGMASIKKQQLLNLAFRHVGPGECYFEVGTYKGKSLISAMLHNPPIPVYACDDFSLFDGNAFEVTMSNLRRYGLEDKVTFYSCDFTQVYTREKLPVPIGAYFYDGAHEEEPQYQAIKLVEPLLADEALVIIDDWRLASDSPSYAKAGTMRAIGESVHTWRLLYDLPARFNGDRAMWWNGVAVFSFDRAP